MSSRTFADRAALAVGRQLANPSGSGGFLLAVMMRVFNRRPTHALIEALDIRPRHHVLDIGCGDGMALSAVPRTTWRYGVDQSETMLSIARRRLNRDLKEGRVRLRLGDMLALPFADRTFTVVTVGYGLRNVPDLQRSLREIRRVLAPGGRLLSLDFNRPTNSAVRAAYLAYLTVVGSALGYALHRDPDTYRYIPESIRNYPGASGVKRMMEELGFSDVRVVPVLGGLMAIHVAGRDATQPDLQQTR